MSEAKEKAAGQKAARKLRSALRREVVSTFERRSGQMAKTTVLPKMKNDFLNRLIIKGPAHLFAHHYGYYRKYDKKKVRVLGKEQIAKAIKSSNVLETLADDISNLRIDAVVAEINF